MSKERRSPERDIIARGKKPKPDPSETREGLFLLASLSAECRRYKQMFQYMKKLVLIVAPSNALLDAERRIFSAACTNYLQSNRDSHRCVAKVANALVGNDAGRIDAAVEYLDLINSEISEICTDVVEIIDGCFLPQGSEQVASAATPESRFFYQKMKGDFLRSLADVKEGSEKNSIALAAHKCYTSAKKDEEGLPATNADRLELNLHLAQLYSELGGQHLTAFNVAREALDMATKEVEATGKAAAGQTAVELGRLREFIDFWYAKFWNKNI